MAVTHWLYGNGVKNIANQTIDWDGGDIRVALCTNAYTPNQDTHETWSDITNETTGTGYTALGEPITGGLTPTYDITTREIRFDCTENPQWTITGSLTARYAIIHQYNVTAGLDLLIGWVDFGQDETATDGTFTITWATNSIFKITVADAV